MPLPSTPLPVCMWVYKHVLCMSCILLLCVCECLKMSPVRKVHPTHSVHYPPVLGVLCTAMQMIMYYDCVCVCVCVYVCVLSRLYFCFLVHCSRALQCLVCVCVCVLCAQWQECSHTYTHVHPSLHLPPPHTANQNGKQIPGRLEGSVYGKRKLL